MYRFGPFALDPKRRSLTRDGSPIQVGPKGFDILFYLVEHPNRVVAKQDLMEAVWPDTVVEEGNLTQQLSLLRKALGDDSRLIVTVARQGYQFTADVSVVPDATVATPRAEPKPWRLGVTLAAVALVTIVVGIGATIAWQRSREPSTVRLAVLPFDNLTGDSTQEYLADGLTEELINHLARFSPDQLGVIARTSVMRYKHTGKRIDEIGRDLSVRYAVESSLRRNANRMRVTVQLIRVRDQSHVWANDFDYAPQDLLQFEDSVATAVAREVRFRVTPVERSRITRASSAENPAAVDAVLRGRDIVRSGSGGRASWEYAKRCFEQAIALDDSYALAWVWMSEIARRGADKGFMPVEEGTRQAREAARRAVALDPNLPQAYGQLGTIQELIDWDWTGASASFERELALDSGSAEAVMNAADMAITLGRSERSVALYRRALALDPFDPRARGGVGQALLDAGHLDEAAHTMENDSAAFPSPIAQAELVEIYLAQGRLADAMTVANRIASPPWQGYVRALVYVRQGRRHAADSALADYIVRYGAFASFQIASVYAYRNEKDSAFAWLDRAYAQRDEGLPGIKLEPVLANLRADPRYGAFLTKMRLPL